MTYIQSFIHLDVFLEVELCCLMYINFAIFSKTCFLLCLLSSTHPHFVIFQQNSLKLDSFLFNAYRLVFWKVDLLSQNEPCV